MASGEPLPDGVVLWTRLAPEPLGGGRMPLAAEFKVIDRVTAVRAPVRLAGALVVEAGRPGATTD